MFSNLIKNLLKTLDLNKKYSRAGLLQGIDQEKFVTYIIIGGFATSLDVGIFLFLHELIVIKALICHSISVPTAAIVSFSLNAYLNFKKQIYCFVALFHFLLL